MASEFASVPIDQSKDLSQKILEQGGGTNEPEPPGGTPASSDGKPDEVKRDARVIDADVLCPTLEVANRIATRLHHLDQQPVGAHRWRGGGEPAFEADPRLETVRRGRDGVDLAVGQARAGDASPEPLKLVTSSTYTGISTTITKNSRPA
jgi:hypothetical protein